MCRDIGGGSGTWGRFKLLSRPCSGLVRGQPLGDPGSHPITVMGSSSSATTWGLGWVSSPTLAVPAHPLAFGH